MADHDFRNLEPTVANNQFELFLGAEKPEEPTLLSYAGEGANIVNAQALGYVARYDVGVRCGVAAGPQALNKFAAERALNCPRGMVIH